MSFLISTVNENEPRVQQILAQQREEQRRQEEEARAHIGDEAINEYRAKRRQEGENPEPVRAGKKKNKGAPPPPPPPQTPDVPALPVPPPPEPDNLQSTGLNSSLLEHPEEKVEPKKKKFLCC